MNKKLQKLYPDKWSHEKIYPHLARHSRITELYSNGNFNDELMRKFAGWEPGSPMAKVYSHLVDSDVNDALDKSWGIDTQERPKTIQPLICPVCNDVNNRENIFCWKCNNILDETKKIKTGINLIKQDDEINKLMDNQEKIIKLLLNLYFTRITKEEYPDLILSKEAEIELLNRIVKIYNNSFK